MDDQNPSHPTLNLILSMALPRNRWIDHVAARLSGAFREFCKQTLSDHIGYKGHDWNAEIERLAQAVRPYLTGQKKTKSKFNIKIALIEAMQDALSAHKLGEAESLLREHPLKPEQRLKLDKLDIDEDELFHKFMQRYFTEDLKRLGFSTKPLR